MVMKVSAGKKKVSPRKKTGKKYPLLTPEDNAIILQKIIEAKQKGDGLLAFGLLVALLLGNAKNEKEFRERERVLSEFLRRRARDDR